MEFSSVSAGSRGIGATLCYISVLEILFFNDISPCSGFWIVLSSKHFGSLNEHWCSKMS